MDHRMFLPVVHPFNGTPIHSVWVKPPTLFKPNTFKRLIDFTPDI